MFLDKAPWTCAVAKAYQLSAQMLTALLFPHFSARVKAISSAFWADDLWGRDCAQIVTLLGVSLKPFLLT